MAGVDPRSEADPRIGRPLAAEHVVVKNAPDWNIGQVLQLIPSHACTTCNLYREIVVHENGRVVEICPIEASGRLT
jgi:D-serine deaminase-like pyridoxal phosphate-dependent protein